MISKELYNDLLIVLEEYYKKGLSPAQCRYFVFTKLSDTNTPPSIIDFIFNRHKLDERDIQFYEELIRTRQEYESIKSNKKKKKAIKIIGKKFTKIINSNILDQTQKIINE